MLTTHVLLPLYNYLKNDRSLSYVAEILSFIGSPEEEILKRQLDRIRYMCDYAYRHTTYYRNLFDDLGIQEPARLTLEDYRRIPVLSKAIIRDRLDDLKSREFTEGELRKTATGGTTSSPTAFYSDWDATYRKRSATAVFDGWMGFLPGMKAAYLWGASQDFAQPKSLKQKLLNDLVQRQLFLAATPLDDEIMEQYYRTLRSYRPFLLQSYPNPLEIFADFLKRKAYRLDIAALSCTAEPLLDSQRSLISEVFRQVPCNWYGAREAGRIATECALHDGMHVNSYCLHVDVVTSTYVDSGMGSIVLTDLWNKAMPLIRYEIGDVGRITADPCPCGCPLPRILEMQGRVTDTFVNSRGQKIAGVGFTNRYIKDAREIAAMQIIQHAIGEFEIKVVAAERFGPDTEAWLRQKLDEFMLEPTRLSITQVREILPENSGKTRFCKNLIL